MTYSANLSFFAAKTSDTGAINSGIDGVPIGANTASTGKFTSVTNTGLTSGRVTYAGASGLLSDSANFTFSGTDLILGAANPNFQGSSSTGSATLVNNSGGAFVRVYGGSHATRANYTDFINASSTSTFTSGGYLGINNTNPITNLDVINSSASGTGAVTTVRLNHAGTTVGDGPRLLFTSGTSTTGGCAIAGYGTALNAADMLFYAGGNTERMRILSTGKVGIGDTSPNQLLTLGSSDGTQALSFVTSAYLGDNALIGNIEFSTHGADASYGNLVNIKAYKTGTNSNSGDLTFWTKNDGATSEKVRINKSGQVGIGTTDPIRPLQIGAYGGGNGEIAIASGTSGWGSILFGDGSSGSDFYRGYIQYQHSGDYMLFSTATAERMRIDSSGNVGIGTSSPTEKLMVVGPIVVSGQLQGLRAASSTLDFAPAENYTRIIATGSDSSTYASIIFVTTTTSTYTERMRITSEGNVGIGTTSPDNNGGYKALTISGTDGGGQIYWKSTTYSVTAYAGADSNGGYLATLTNHPLILRTNNTERMRIDSSGNLLVGVTSLPTGGGKLVVSSSAAETKVNIVNTGTGGIHYWIGSTNNSSGAVGGGKFAIYDQTTDNTRLVITAAGLIGIGTTAPFTKLEVGGTGQLFRVNASAIGNNYWEFYRSSTRTAFIGTGDNATDNFYITNESNADILFRTNATERMRILAGGNVGIGTTDPNAKLEVNGAIRSSRPENVGYYTELKTNYSDVTTLQLNLLGNVILQAGLTNDTNLYTSGSTSYMKFYTNGTERMGITSAGVPNIGAPGNRVYNTWGGAFALQIGQSANFYGDGNFYNWNAGISLNTYRYSNAWYNISAGVPVAKFEIANGGTGSFGGFSWWWGPDAGSNQGAASWSQIMSLSSNGSLLLGTTSSYGGEKFTLDFTGNNQRGMVVRNTTSTTQDSVAFVVNSTFVGWISASTTGTAYNTISDYRLKENVVPMTGALAKVTQLKPVTYKWKSNNSNGQGFIAHELAEVIPDCVTGEKDAVDADGNPKYQGVDTSFLVATLTAAIQEQQALIESLTTRLTALENK